jgi:hypothetical protein
VAEHIINYKKNGQPFVSLLSVLPIDVSSVLVICIPPRLTLPHDLHLVND